MEVSIHHVGDTPEEQYLVSCARVRDISITCLVRELITVIARDQLVLATLDDEGRHERRRYARRFHGKSNCL